MATRANRVFRSYLSGITAKLPKRLKLCADRNPANLVRVGVIGYGYWGPNVVRNLYGLEDCQLAAICDKNPAGLRRAGQAHPGVELLTDSSELLTSLEIDAIAVVTPVFTHFDLAKAALLQGTHVLAVNPVTSLRLQAED